jgi:hypothetical protein
MKTFLLLVALLGCAVACLAMVADSPYPKAKTLAVKVYAVDMGCNPSNMLMPLLSMAGVLAQTQPQIVVLKTDADRYWLADAVANRQLAVDNSFQCNAQGLLTKFVTNVPSYVLCTDGASLSLHAAISLAVVHSAIVVPESAKSTIDGLRFKQVADARSMNPTQVFSLYSTAFSKRIAVLQKPDVLLGGNLVDYALFARAFTFWVDKCEGSDIFNAVTSSMLPGKSAVFGWGNDEKDFTAAASAKGTFVHAADWASGLALYTNLRVSLPTTRLPLPVAAPATATNKHTVTFLMSDGDNVQWMINGFASDTRWWGSPQRGQVPIGWTMNPALAEIAPNIYKHILATATKNDGFAIPPSGPGYMYPETMASDAKDAWTTYTAFTNQYAKAYPLTGTILNVIGHGDDTSRAADYLAQPDISAIFWYPYSDYSGLSGAIQWKNGKPVIGGRFNLWEGFNTPEQLASKLNSQSTDPSSAQGYSVIPVHVWSRTVADVVKTVSLLDSNKVQVVLPEEFVRLVIENVRG